MMPGPGLYGDGAWLSLIRQQQVETILNAYRAYNLTNVNINIGMGIMPGGCCQPQIPPFIIIQLIMLLIQLLQSQQCGCHQPPIFGPIGGGFPGFGGVPSFPPYCGSPLPPPFGGMPYPPIGFPPPLGGLPPFPAPLQPPNAIDYGMAIGGSVGGTVGGIAGGFVGWQAGASIGAALGTAIFPGVGTLVGGLLGGIVGSIGGSALGQAVGGFIGKVAGGIVGGIVEVGKGIFEGVKKLFGFG